MLIPWRELDPETLDRLLSEIVTRDGTDYGLQETPTATKVNSARKSLERGRAELHWDEESETTALLSVDQVREEAARVATLRRDSGIEPVD